LVPEKGRGLGETVVCRENPRPGKEGGKTEKGGTISCHGKILKRGRTVFLNSRIPKEGEKRWRALKKKTDHSLEWKNQLLLEKGVETCIKNSEKKRRVFFILARGGAGSSLG